MQSLAKNLFAALTGQAGRALISLIAVPLYLPLLGAEAFGLVGFHGALMAVLALVDGGLGVAANREVARCQEDHSTENPVRVFVRTLEWIYWSIGLLLAVCCVGASGWFARNWLTPKEVPLETIANCLAVLGIGVALRWPTALYNGVLVGSQRLVFLNTVSLIMGAGYGLGGYLVLRYINNSPLAFFQWQLLLNLLEVGALAWYTWRILPRFGLPPRFSRREIQRVQKFALGNALLALVSIGLTNSDRLLLGKFLPLQSLGHYSVATQVNGVISRFGGVFYTLFFPRFSRLSVKEDRRPLLEEFFRGLQLVSILIFPCYGLTALLMPTLLRWWLRDEGMAIAAAGAARWLIVGSMLNAVMLMHHALLLALGIADYTVRQNTLALIAYLPMLYWLIGKFGVEGAAMAWALLNLGYYIISPFFIFKKIKLVTCFKTVYRITLPPLLLYSLVFAVIEMFFHAEPIRHLAFGSLSAALLMLFFVTQTPWIFSHLRTLCSRFAGGV